MSIRVNTSGLDEFIKDLEKAKVNTKSVCIKAVDKAAPLLKESLQNEIRRAANRGYSTGNPGNLADSVSAMDARENEYGVFSVVGPQGNDENGISNEEKLLWLENGAKRSGRGGLMKRAGPVRRRAVNGAQGKCETAMQQEIEGFLDNTFGD